MEAHRSLRYVLSLTVLLAMILFGGAGSILAQGQAPAQASGVSAGTDFTYQGQLYQNNQPLTASCSMTFSLFDQAAGGAAVGSPITQPVTVTAGIFAATLDFGPDIFTGDARWLAVAVQCPGDTGYTDLGAREPLAPAPYALALPGLRTQPNATSPNVIGGYSGNIVRAGAVAATIAGGGAFSVANNVDADAATIGGGSANFAGGTWATVAGGTYNQAAASEATVGGGRLNMAGWASTVGGGRQNVAFTEAATVAGGWTNRAQARYSSVGGGISNLAGAEFSTVSGGQQNHATSGYAAIGGGYANNASGGFSTVPGGLQADAMRYGELAYASGSFTTTAGLAQSSTFVLRNTTTDANPAPLFLNGVSQTVWLTTTSALAFDALVVGQSDTGAAAAYHITGLVKSVAGTVSFVGTPQVTVLGEDVPAWDANVVTMPQYGASLLVRVTGAPATTIRWVATIRASQVAW